MTAPFGPALEASLKRPVQGARFTVQRGDRVYPEFFCCISGTDVGVDKDPVAVMAVSTTHACTGEAITVDYSLSWSPSSTIASWEVDWGDGNVSNGAWPGAGSVAHPLGGYTLPGPYDITLTVTDLLVAHGDAVVMVNIVDCLAGPPVMLIGGCGASGPWETLNSGLDWTTIGGGVLNSFEIYDLVSLPAFIGYYWAATSGGLFKTIDGGIRWFHIDLPQPDGLTGAPVAYSLLSSTVVATELYVLAYVPTASRVYLYRTDDGGATWTYLLLQSTLISAREVDATVYGRGPKLAVLNGRLYGLSYDDGVYLRRADGSGVWDTLAMGTITDCLQLAAHNGYLWLIRTTVDDYPVYWDGIGWNQFTYDDSTPVTADGLALWADSNGDLWLWTAPPGGNKPGIWHFTAGPGTYTNRGGTITLDTSTDANHVLWYQESADAWFASADYTGLPGNQFEIDENEWHEDMGFGFPPDYYTVSTEYMQGVVGYSPAWGTIMPYAFADWQGEALCARGSMQLIKWEWVISAGVKLTTGWNYWGPECTYGITCIKVINGSLYAATTTPANLYRLMNDEWIFVGQWNAAGSVVDFISYNDSWYAAITCGGVPGSCDGLYRMGPDDDLVIPDTGRTHLMDMDINGRYVLVGLLKETGGEPIIHRVIWDLSAYDIVYDPGAGTWGGTACDPMEADVFWAYGDFGAAKIIRSDDHGETWTDLTDAGWGGSELVRPVLPSAWDHRDIVILLNDAQECWQSGDLGETWLKISDTAFSCDCAARDPWEPRNVWIGRVSPGGVMHLQYGPCNGVTWIEHSNGFTPSAPVTALEVVG